MTFVFGNSINLQGITTTISNTILQLQEEIVIIEPGSRTVFDTKEETFNTTAILLQQKYGFVYLRGSRAFCWLKHYQFFIHLQHKLQNERIASIQQII